MVGVGMVGVGVGVVCVWGVVSISHGAKSAARMTENPLFNLLLAERIGDWGLMLELSRCPVRMCWPSSL